MTKRLLTTMFGVGLLVVGLDRPAYATPFNFNFNAPNLATGGNAAAVKTYMDGVLGAAAMVAVRVTPGRSSTTATPATTMWSGQAAYRSPSAPLMAACRMPRPTTTSFTPTAAPTSRCSFPEPDLPSRTSASITRSFQMTRAITRISRPVAPPGRAIRSCIPISRSRQKLVPAPGPMCSTRSQRFR